MMQLTRRITLFILFLLLLHAPVYAKSERTISPEQWKQLASDKAFNYVNDIEKVKEQKPIQPGIFAKMFRALFNFLGSGGGTFLLWMLVGGVVIYILYKLVLNKESFMFSRGRKKQVDNDLHAEEEDITSTNWEALQQQAMNNDDLRLAIRYGYMRLLQLLQHRELIQYRIDKTNYEYAAELNDTNYKQPFKQLSRQYEYAWYGGFAPSASAYREYQDLFNNVKKQLGA